MEKAIPVRTTEKVMAVTDDEELRKRGYQVGHTLGEGSYAKVKCAYSEKLQKKIALKIINRRKAPKDFQQKFLPRELEVMKILHHPNVIQMFQVLQFNGKVFIAMEMAGHGDLLEYIKLRGALSDEKSKELFQQLVNAVEYLHSANVVHRDLKCENILLDTHNSIKVTDFGFARTLMPGDLSRTFCGSAAYAAPEILQGIPYTGEIYDIWSMGVILYIMVCGSMPFDDSNIKKMIKCQTEKRVSFSRSKKVCNDCKDLIASVLNADVKTRYTMRQIQNSAWLLGRRMLAHKVGPPPGSAPVMATDSRSEYKSRPGVPSRTTTPGGCPDAHHQSGGHSQAPRVTPVPPPRTDHAHTAAPSSEPERDRKALPTSDISEVMTGIEQLKMNGADPVSNTN